MFAVDKRSTKRECLNKENQHAKHLYRVGVLTQCIRRIYNKEEDSHSTAMIHSRSKLNLARLIDVGVIEVCESPLTTKCLSGAHSCNYFFSQASSIGYVL